MRAWSAKQRFPIAEWLRKVEKLHNDVIKIHMKFNRDIAKPAKASTMPSHNGENLKWPHDMVTEAKLLSWDEVVGSRRDFELQNTNPIFTDPRGDYYRNLGQALKSLTVNNSVSELCLENYLVKSEREWFNMYLDAKLGRFRHNLSEKPSSRVALRPRRKLHHTRKRTYAINCRLLFRRNYSLCGRNSKPFKTMTVEDGDAGHYTSSVSIESRDNYCSQFGIPQSHNPPVGVAK